MFVGWDVPVGLAGGAMLLAKAAESAAGYSVTDLGVLAPIQDRASRPEAARTSAAQDGSNSDIARVLQWYFSYPWIRTISPFSTITVPEFILRFPERAKSHFPGHPVTRRCVWPLPPRPDDEPVRPSDLDPACAGSALDPLVKATLLQPAEAGDLLQKLLEHRMARD